MAIEKKPFVSYTLNEERTKKKRDVVVVSLDINDRLLLDQMKLALNCPYDSTLLKILTRAGAKVILGHLAAKDLKYLCGRDRNRLGENLRGELELKTIK